MARSQHSGGSVVFTLITVTLLTLVRPNYKSRDLLGYLKVLLNSL